MEFTVKIYELTANFPKTEQFGLTSQLRRAATSIPLNISEGAGAGSDAEFHNSSNERRLDAQTQKRAAPALNRHDLIHPSDY